MTNEEMLKYIKEFVEYFAYWKTSDLFEKIVKYVEILAILKRIDWSIFNNGDKNDFSWYIDTNKPMKITEEEVKKIKEWLNEQK